jgi:hypothetical protein
MEAKIETPTRSPPNQIDSNFKKEKTGQGRANTSPGRGRGLRPYGREYRRDIGGFLRIR